MMLTRLLRPLCRIGLHARPIRVIDSFDVIGFSVVYGIEGRVTRSHMECRRCRRTR